MTDEEFWALISLADLKLVDQEDCLSGVAPIAAALSKESPENICDFEEIMSQKLYALDHAVLIDELESSSDSFLYQRCYAVVSGPRFYADTFSKEKRNLGDFDWCQSLIYVAQNAWTKSQDSEWEFTASVSYETGSNEEGHKPDAKLSYSGKEYGADEQPQSNTLCQAIQNEDYALAFSMIDSGEDLNMDNPLYAAVEKNHQELIIRLIEKGADVDQPIIEGGGAYVTPLALAVMKNKVGIVKSFLAAGAAPTAKHGDEFCPLETACDRGNMRLAKLLLEAGANPDSQKPGGSSKLKQGSPLFSAVRSNKPKMVELVLGYGAYPDIWDENRKLTPLVGASVFAEYADSEEADKTLKIIQSLITSGSDVNIRRESQNTLLQSLVGEGEWKISEKRMAIRKRVVSLLIENGARMNDGTIPKSAG
ncbi:hypothetical protein GCM10011309_01250 [Litorimonas cladophorae]|uniref:DUF4240 domain-containing protein n=1 Tax=Litorimonas cladophorae TaxID=1220491 RepID=A0A918KA54_9PROT|nr:ankyrin repeat domain-containing protein [Litorimonas cladophorae]GGX56265.1 hypothetical protein GCM10011309_01250 [Litorimonas cladophorae]